MRSYDDVLDCRSWYICTVLWRAAEYCMSGWLRSHQNARNRVVRSRYVGSA